MVASTSEIGSADDSLGFWDFSRFLKKTLKFELLCGLRPRPGDSLRTVPKTIVSTGLATRDS
jgi:hypothetical protein